MKLSKNQTAYLQDLRKNHSLIIGLHTPAILKTFQSLVRKGLAEESKLAGGWQRFTAK